MHWNGIITITNGLHRVYNEEKNRPQAQRAQTVLQLHLQWNATLKISMYDFSNEYHKTEAETDKQKWLDDVALLYNYVVVIVLVLVFVVHSIHDKNQYIEVQWIANSLDIEQKQPNQWMNSLSTQIGRIIRFGLLGSLITFIHRNWWWSKCWWQRRHRTHRLQRPKETKITATMEQRPFKRKNKQFRMQWQTHHIAVVFLKSLV